MSLRTKIVALNAAVLAIALLAAAVALVGLWAALGPLHRVVAGEASAVAVAERLGLQPAQAEVIEAALADARAAERAVTHTALLASAIPVALLSGGGIACAVFSLRLSRRLLDRLTALADATHRVAGGDRTVRVAATTAPTHRQDELDSLIDAFNRMIDQLAAAETRARDAELLKTRFFAGVSHDLRTPLTTIAGLLESLRRDEWDGPTRAEFLDVAHREAMRLNRLVSDLLDLTRLEAHAWTLDREAVRLDALARSLVSDLSLPGGPLAGRDVSLHVDGECVAWGDELQLRRVLQNLLTNAAKFSPPTTPIAVETRHDPVTDAIHVAVVDRGPGIATTDLSRVFDRFYRGSTTNGTSGQSGQSGQDGHGGRNGQDGQNGRAAPGTGLGLTIAKGIVEAHGGRIWVEPAGGGARFIFTTPGTVA